MGKAKTGGCRDQTSQDLIQVIRHGFPEQNNMLDDSLRQFYHMRGDLYEVEGVPFLHWRMFDARKSESRGFRLSPSGTSRGRRDEGEGEAEFLVAWTGC